MFTYDTITDDDGVVLIEVIAGLGEDLVSGRVIPESFEVDKASLYPRDDPDGDSILSFYDVESLAVVAMEIETYLGAPQDIEYAIDFNDKIWICQSRPVVL
jgi:pyruvate,water dikinase